MASKKPGDALKAKQKKQKIFVAIGMLGLLGAAAYEVPMVMGGGAKPAAVATTTTPVAPAAAAPQATPATGAPPTLAPPTPATAPAQAAGVGVGQLVDTDLTPPASQTSLVGFSLFRSKDPFVQQISPTAADPATISGSAADPSTGAAVATPADGSASGGAATGGDTSSGNGAAASSGTPGSFVPETGNGSSGSSSGATQTGETVMLSVNGRQETVGKGGTFPQSAPTFRLVSFGKGTAEIGIVGGSYAAGNPTVTLKKGVPLTLVNTLDDTRYRIVLTRTP